MHIVYLPRILHNSCELRNFQCVCRPVYSVNWHDVTADRQARLISGHTHRALKAGHVSARDLCHSAVQYTEYFEYRYFNYSHFASFLPRDARSASAVLLS